MVCQKVCERGRDDPSLVLCGYSHHIVLFGQKKDSQERLASRICALLDIMLNDDNSSANLVCEVQAES